MYKGLALINGIILAIMVFINGMQSSIIGPYLGTLIYHVLGLAVILFISVIKKNKLSNFKTVPFVFFLPGVLSVATILLNNISMLEIGITISIGVSLFGQLVASSLVEHFGLFGMPINKLRKEKALGFSIITLGIIVMIIM